MKRSLILVILLSSVAVFVIGVTTDLRFSDEVYHFLFSKDWYNLGHRPVRMESVNNLKEIGYSYVRQYGEVPLWHFGLFFLWELRGCVSENVAQFYQALFYFLLVLSSYLTAKELYGKEVAWYATIVVATVPAITAFSVLLHQEVAVAGLTTLCLLLIIKRKIAWSAVVMGLALLTKRNAFFLFPVFLLIILFLRNTSPKISMRIKKAFLFLVIVVMITVPDLIIRYKSLGWLFFIGDEGRISKILETTVRPPLSPDSSGSPASPPFPEKRITSYVPGSVYRTANIPQYLGVSLSFLLLLFLTNVKKIFSSKDLILIFPIFIYLIFFFGLFREWAAARLLSPIVPLLAILASKVFISLKSDKLKYLIYGLCALQFIGVLIFVYTQRKLTPDEIKAFDYLKKEVSIESRVLTIEESMLFYSTNLRAFSGQIFNFVNNGDYDDFLWGDNEENKKDILEKYKIDYLFVQKARIYDDSKIRHFGGWPKSFVDELPSMPFLEKVFENKDVFIWKVQS